MFVNMSFDKKIEFWLKFCIHLNDTLYRSCWNHDQVRPGTSSLQRMLNNVKMWCSWQAFRKQQSTKCIYCRECESFVKSGRCTQAHQSVCQLQGILEFISHQHYPWSLQSHSQISENTMCLSGCSGSVTRLRCEIMHALRSKEIQDIVC